MESMAIVAWNHGLEKDSTGTRPIRPLALPTWFIAVRQGTEIPKEELLHVICQLKYPRPVIWKNRGEPWPRPCNSIGNDDLEEPPSKRRCVGCLGDRSSPQGQSAQPLSPPLSHDSQWYNPLLGSLPEAISATEDEWYISGHDFQLGFSPFNISFDSSRLGYNHSTVIFFGIILLLGFASVIVVRLPGSPPSTISSTLVEYGPLSLGEMQVTALFENYGRRFELDAYYDKSRFQRWVMNPDYTVNYEKSLFQRSDMNPDDTVEPLQTNYDLTKVFVSPYGRRVVPRLHNPTWCVHNWDSLNVCTRVSFIEFSKTKRISIV
jgi:hypothetical protein